MHPGPHRVREPCPVQPGPGGAGVGDQRDQRPHLVGVDRHRHGARSQDQRRRDDRRVPGSPDPTSKALFGQLIGGQFEVAIFWWIAVAVGVTVLLQMMPYRNWIFAIGGDKESARATGNPVAKVKIALYMASGFGAALVGVIQTILYNGAQVANGQAFVFNSIIAVVIGGVLLTGGYGSVVGVVMGTLTFAIVNQGIYYTGWNSDWAALILGILILVAVLMNNTFRRLALSTPRSPKKA
ncbi:ABC transporter permease [Streptomyces sp. NPDC057099]|uniref:ABC transporter permease n=1 Tax=Streptomyces sp. NPDC057099 TaxID=3346019 RepID=UPI003625EFB8